MENITEHAKNVGKFLSVLYGNKEFSYIDEIAKATNDVIFLQALRKAIRRATVYISKGEGSSRIPREDIDAVVEYVQTHKKPSDILKIGSIIAIAAAAEGLIKLKSSNQ